MAPRKSRFLPFSKKSFLARKPQKTQKNPKSISERVSRREKRCTFDRKILKIFLEIFDFGKFPKFSSRILQGSCLRKNPKKISKKNFEIFRKKVYRFSRRETHSKMHAIILQKKILTLFWPFLENRFFRKIPTQTSKFFRPPVVVLTAVKRAQKW